MWRRDFLRVGSLTLGGVSLSDVIAGRSKGASVPANPTTSVILLYLHGGPSQLETYDLKPNAPSDYRSIFREIPTNVVGMRICEWFPWQARLADKFSLIRSLSHDIGIHSDGGIMVLTGKRPTRLDPTSQSKSEHPDFGSVTSRCRGLGAHAVPPYVAIPQRLYMTRPAYLGAHHASFELGDPSAKQFAPPSLTLHAANAQDLLADRRGLLKQLDNWRRDADAAGAMATADEYQQTAFEMLTSNRMARAFDLQQEADALRDRYGRHLWGQGCLLARRLAQAGAGVISLFIDTPQNGPEFTNWDDHILNAGRPGHFGKFLERRLPYLDQAVSALIEDIHARQLQQQILVVVMGEFGRTPRLSQNANGVGRDHWPQAYSALVSGGGLRMGQVVGATNSKAEYPIDAPYGPQDLLAMIYRHLEIDVSRTFHDFAGRPTPILSGGRLIQELC